MWHESKYSIPASPIPPGDSAVTTRCFRHGEHLQSRWGGDHYGPTYSKYNFHCATPSVTIGAGHVSPCTANTGTPIHAFYNPPNSGCNVHIVKHSVCTISGTPGGPFLWNHFINQSITAATTLNPVCGWVGGAVPKSLWFHNTAFTGCTTGTLFRHAWRFPAIATGYSEGPAHELDDWDMLIPPGSCLGLFAFATGASHVCQSSISFVELPI